MLRFLKEQCGAKRIGAVGFCWGGVATHYLALKYPEIKAGVSVYGVSVSFCKSDVIKLSIFDNSVRPAGIVREREDRYELKSPTLFIFGEKDEVIPLDQVSGPPTFIALLKPHGGLHIDGAEARIHWPPSGECTRGEAGGELQGGLPGEDLSWSDSWVCPPQERRHQPSGQVLHPGGQDGYAQLVEQIHVNGRWLGPVDFLFRRHAGVD